jgi:hypothetical protein
MAGGESWRRANRETNIEANDVRLIAGRTAGVQTRSSPVTLLGKLKRATVLVTKPLELKKA